MKLTSAELTKLAALVAQVEGQASSGSVMEKPVSFAQLVAQRQAKMQVPRD